MILRRQQYTIAWHDHEFPLVTREHLKTVKRKATRGVFRKLLLEAAEDRLRQGTTRKTQIERCEEKLDELLKHVRQGARLPVSETRENDSDSGDLTQEERERLERILNIT